MLEKFNEESDARIFSDYLTQLDIDNQIAIGSDGVCEIWIIDEDDIPNAEQLLKKFRESPGNTDYSEISQKAKQKRKQAQKEANVKVPYIDARTQVFGRGLAPRGNVTLFLIIVSVAVGLFSGLGAKFDFLLNFFISQYTVGLTEIGNGQIWRLITPIFIHFGIMHLVFNMMWLYDLGNMIEDRKGSWFFGIFIVVVASFSNMAQFLASGPVFGGMSGVVYGLLGYVWMKSKYDPNSRLYMHKTTVTMMLVWFLLCWTGILGPIANYAHTAGLVAGVAWGFLSSPGWKHHFK